MIAEIAPQPGRALLFSQDLLHDGSTLLSGAYPKHTYTHKHTSTHTTRHTHFHITPSQSRLCNTSTHRTHIHRVVHTRHTALTSQALNTFFARRLCFAASSLCLTARPPSSPPLRTLSASVRPIRPAPRPWTLVRTPLRVVSWRKSRDAYRVLCVLCILCVLRVCVLLCVFVFVCLCA